MVGGMVAKSTNIMSWDDTDHGAVCGEKAN